MRRERSVAMAAEAAAASFDRIVEFVNFAIAIALVAASWVLVVELVGWFDRHNHR